MKKARKHRWTVSYPRETWPLYECATCGERRCPTAEELRSKDPPAWWTTECKPPKPPTKDDVEWLTGTGRYDQG
jgi:hypothetical protein